ncbi:MAG TPA: lactate utilization protein [Candidatus Binataceae bacterium]|nr:lactate utilization protein [Candidatus Binataceae bacterium]
MSNGTTPASAAAADRATLQAQFTKELRALSAQVVEATSEREAIATLANLASRLGVGSIGVGADLSLSAPELEAALQAAGCQITWVPRQATENFTHRLAELDAGLVEAEHGIALTGTLAMLASPGRARSLSLIPKISFVLLRADRILPDLAAVLSTIGPARLESYPMVLVTGPSRTGDIEKRLVLGVHGPTALYVIVLAAASDGTHES